MRGTLKDPFTREVIYFLLFVFVIYGIHVQLLYHYLELNEAALENINRAYLKSKDEHRKTENDLNELLDEYKALLEENNSYKRQKDEFLRHYNKMTANLENMHSEVRQLADRNKELTQKIEELEAELKNKEMIIEQLKLSLDKNGGNRDNDGDKKIAYLTFDDGPSKNTEKILDILKGYNIKATFFVLGKPNMGHLYRRIVEEGHALGNHTYSHDFDKIYSSPDNFRNDIEQLESLVYGETGIILNLFRFPGGSNNYMMNRSDKKYSFRDFSSVLEEKGYCYFDWNVDSGDAKVITQDADVIKRSVLNGMPKKSNAIILFHDAPTKTTTVEVLPEIIEELINRGYSFSRLTPDSVPVQFFK